MKPKLYRTLLSLLDKMKDRSAIGIVHLLRRHLPGITFKAVESMSLRWGDIAVTGEYDDEKDRVIVMVMHPPADNFGPKYEKLDDFAFSVFQTILHERRHQYQFGCRGGEYGPMPNKIMKMSESAHGTVAENILYLGDPDEIDAFAGDIALELKYKRINSIFESPEYLKYKTHFGANSEVTRKLVKKAYIKSS